MSKGRVWNDPQFRYEDAFSGREIVRLTDYLGHSSHLYFTDPGWFNHDRSFVFNSDREGQSDLYRYDLDDGKITQLTDYKDQRRRLGGCFSEANQCHYYWHKGRLMELDIDTLAERTVYEAPPDVSAGRASPTADGKYIMSQLQHDIPQDKAAVSFAYSRFREYFYAKPLTQIIRQVPARHQRQGQGGQDHDQCAGHAVIIGPGPLGE